MRNVHRIQKRKLPKVGPVVRALRKGPYRGATNDVRYSDPVRWAPNRGRPMMNAKMFGPWQGSRMRSVRMLWEGYARTSLETEINLFRWSNRA